MWTSQTSVFAKMEYYLVQLKQPNTNVNMIFTMKFFPILYLLILLSACQNNKESQSQAANLHIQPIEENALQLLIEESTKPYIVVNFFASYCKPCRKDLPSLVEMKNEARADVELVFISIDKEDAIHTQLPEFLKEMQMSFPSYYWKGENLTPSIKKYYEDWDGTIPLTLVFNKKGKLLANLKLAEKEEIEVIIQNDKAFSE